MSSSRTRLGSAGRRERGAAAVEFAIILPLLCAILFGIVEFSIIMYDKAMITSASREGARFGSVYRSTDLSPFSRPSCGEIYTTAVQPYEDRLVAFSGPKTIGVICTKDGAAVSNSVEICTLPAGGLANAYRVGVRTTFTYNFLVVPNFVLSLTGPLTLTSETIMRCE